MSLAAALQPTIHHILLFVPLMSLLMLICTSLHVIASTFLGLTEITNEVSATGTDHLAHESSSRSMGAVSEQ